MKHSPPASDAHFSPPPPPPPPAPKSRRPGPRLARSRSSRSAFSAPSPPGGRGGESPPRWGWSQCLGDNGKEAAERGTERSPSRACPWSTGAAAAGVALSLRQPDKRPGSVGPRAADRLAGEPDAGGGEEEPLAGGGAGLAGSSHRPASLACSGRAADADTLRPALQRPAAAVERPAEIQAPSPSLPGCGCRLLPVWRHEHTGLAVPESVSPHLATESYPPAPTDSDGLV